MLRGLIHPKIFPLSFIPGPSVAQVSWIGVGIICSSPTRSIHAAMIDTCSLTLGRSETPRTRGFQGMRALLLHFSIFPSHVRLRKRRSESGSSSVTPGDRLYNLFWLRAPFSVLRLARMPCCEGPAPSQSNTVSHLSRTGQTYAILPSRMMHLLAHCRDPIAHCPGIDATSSHVPMLL